MLLLYLLLHLIYTLCCRVEHSHTCACIPAPMCLSSRFALKKQSRVSGRFTDRDNFCSCFWGWLSVIIPSHMVTVWVWMVSNLPESQLQVGSFWLWDHVQFHPKKEILRQEPCAAALFDLPRSNTAKNVICSQGSLASTSPEGPLLSERQNWVTNACRLFSISCTGFTALEHESEDKYFCHSKRENVFAIYLIRSFACQ